MSYEKSISIIKDAQILEEKDLNTIKKLKNELEDTFKNVQIFRTRTEMETSVLTDLYYPSPDAKYWQSVREQNIMFKELVLLSYEYRKNQVEIKKMNRSLEKETDDLEKELLKIEIERRQFLSLDMQRIAHDRIREIKQWHEIKQRLIPDMKYSLTDVNEHQLASHTKRWINQLLGAGNSGSLPERSNLLSQLEMGLKICRENGILEEVLKPFPENIQIQLKELFFGIGEDWLLPSISCHHLQEKT